MTLYFAYGSNMCQEQMDKRCPGHRMVGGGVLRRYRWIISARGYANVVKSPTDAVYGVIYEISTTDEERLDRYEGVKSGSYARKHLDVEVNGSPEICLVYVDPVTDEGVPGKEYIDRINRGIEDARLPQKYVEESIRKFLPGP